MTSITFNYDGKNTLIKSIFHTAVLAGATQIATEKITPSGLDDALNDVRLGRVYTAQNAKSLIDACLN